MRLSRICPRVSGILMAEETRHVGDVGTGKRGGKWPGTVLHGAFFLFFGLHIRFFVDPKLIYHILGVVLWYPKANLDNTVLQQHLARPGGMIEYASGLLSQCFCFSWAGTLIITITAWAIWSGSRAIMQRAGGPRCRFLACVPVMILLGFTTAYNNLLTTSLALAAVIWAAVMCQQMADRRRTWRVAAFVVTGTLCYHVAGGISLVFVLLVSAHECLVKRRPVTALGYLGFGLAVPLIFGCVVSDLPAPDVYLVLVPHAPLGELWQPSPMGYVYLLSVPVLAMLAAGWRALSPKWHARLGRHHICVNGTTDRVRGNEAPYGRPYSVIGGIVLTLAVALACILYSRSPYRRNICLMHFYARHRMWEHIIRLDHRRGLPPNQFSEEFMHDVNRALYHTGRLGNAMFAFPQSVNTLFLSDVRTGGKARNYLRKCELALDLGDVNTAERKAYEVLENRGASPRILETLALINIVKGQPETARVFLKALSKDLVFGTRGREQLQRLDEDPRLEQEARVKRLRSLMLTQDVVVTGDSPTVREGILLRLLERNDANRMAHDYLIALYLLNRQPKVVAAVNQAGRSSFGELQEHHAEAVLLHRRREGDTPTALPPRVGRGAIQRYGKFQAILNEILDDVGAAERRLAPEFGRSYFFYYLFEKSGVLE